mgnify:CR=1
KPTLTWKPFKKKTNISIKKCNGCRKFGNRINLPDTDGS